MNRTWRQLVFSIHFFSVPLFAAELPLANWAVTESRDNFFDCSRIKDAMQISPLGNLYDFSVNAKTAEDFLTEARLPGSQTHYYCFSYEKAKKPDPKHEVVHSNRALGIRAFVHVRDYEANSIDGGFLEWFGSKDFDTVHVLAVADSKL